MGCTDGYLSNEQIEENELAKNLFNSSWSKLSDEQRQHIREYMSLKNRVKKIDKFIASIR